MIMKAWICYPMPLDNRVVEAEFKPYAKRFVETWMRHPPGAACVLSVVCAHKEAPPDVRKIFEPLKPDYVTYHGYGADMGAAQFLASMRGGVIVAMTSRCYFHRGGWLRRLAAARGAMGMCPGLYGLSGSSEQGGHNHLCLRAYALDAFIWNNTR